MHDLVTILTAPSPITPDNYHTELYAWGDEVHLAGPPLSRAWSHWAHYIGYQDAQLDQNLRRIGTSIQRALTELQRYPEYFRGHEVSAIWEPVSSLAFVMAAKCTALSRTLKHRTLLLQWIQDDPDKMEAQWGHLSAILQTDLPSWADFAGILRNANDVAQQWRCLTHVEQHVGAIPIVELHQHMSSMHRRFEPTLRLQRWCHRLNNSQEVSQAQSEQFLQLLSAAGHRHQIDNFDTKWSVSNREVEEEMRYRYRPDSRRLQQAKEEQSSRGRRGRGNHFIGVLGQTVESTGLRQSCNMVTDQAISIISFGQHDPRKAEKRRLVRERQKTGPLNPGQFTSKLREVLTRHGLRLVAQRRE